MSASVGPTTIIDDSLVLHLDAANSRSYPGTGTVWTDLSGRGNHGTLVNGPTYDSANKGSIVFDGANDHITIPHSTSYKVGFPAALCGIFKLKSSGLRMLGIFNDDTTAQHRGLSLTVSNGVLGAGYGNGTVNNSPGRRTYTTSASLSLGVWYYASAIFFDNLNCQIYLNGSPITTTFSSGTGTTLAYSTGEAAIGRKRDVSLAYYDATVSQVQIYNRALTAAEVRQNFISTKSRFNL